MSQSHGRKRFIRTALLALWISLVYVRPLLAAGLEVDELIESIRNQISAAEKRARQKPVFGIKEVKLTISYSVEKKGEGDFKAFVITAGASINSQAVQMMEITLMPLKQLKVERQRPEEERQRIADQNGNDFTHKEIDDIVAMLSPPEPPPYTRGLQLSPPIEGRGIEIKEYLQPSYQLPVFAPNSAEVLPKAYSALSVLGAALKELQPKGYLFQIRGHTDSLGSVSYNLELSKKRANNVKKILIERFSIDPRILEVEGYGMTKPIATNDTPEGRQLNRRIEIVNLGIP